MGDSASWVLDGEAREIAEIACQIVIQVANPNQLERTKNQCVFYTSRYKLLSGDWKDRPHRLATAYFHGRPGSGVPAFNRLYQSLCLNNHRLHRVQVSHTEMRDVVLSSGIDPQKVFLIPIGVNLSYFKQQTDDSRRKTRARLGIPQSAAVIGSFQKDGVGWEEGLEPKLIKGPDVFLKTIELLKPRLPELYVLLSGPARGFVKTGLERLGVPYVHRYVGKYSDIGDLYQALDLYIVASRQEGGPKAVLESIASGVPLVTTRVGQAMDLVKHGENGWMVDVEDVEGLAFWAEYVLLHRSELDRVISNGFDTAQKNCYISQLPLWENFFKGFVNW